MNINATSTLQLVASSLVSIRVSPEFNLHDNQGITGYSALLEYLVSLWLLLFELYNIIIK